MGEGMLSNVWTQEEEDSLIEILYKKQLRYMRAGRAKVVSGA